MLTTNVKRREFCFIYDVENGNPNGNPDDGGAPRTDLDDFGEVTAECIKRKLRTAIDLMMGHDDGTSEAGYEMYVRRGSVLNRAVRETYEQAGIEIKAPSSPKTPKAGKSSTKSNAKGAKMKSKTGSTDDDEADESERKIEEKDMRVSADEALKGNVQLCKRFFDTRWFGAVVVGVGSGRITGPLQLQMGKSVLPVELRQIGNTRCATTNEKQAEEQRGRNQNQSRKSIIPHAVYIQKGHLNAFQAKNTGFTESDWEMFLKAAEKMLEIDRASGRGFMTLRQLVIFEHEDPLGNARAADLFKLISVKPKNPDERPASWNDYAVSIDRSKLPKGIKLQLIYPEDDTAVMNIDANANPNTDASQNGHRTAASKKKDDAIA
jgi:CRISPR-associated protein Csd2